MREHKLLAPDVDLADLATQTKNFTSAEIEGSSITVYFDESFHTGAEVFSHYRLQWYASYHCYLHKVTST